MASSSEQIDPCAWRSRYPRAPAARSTYAFAPTLPETASRRQRGRAGPGRETRVIELGRGGCRAPVPGSTNPAQESEIAPEQATELATELATAPAAPLLAAPPRRLATKTSAVPRLAFAAVAVVVSPLDSRAVPGRPWCP
jgi:hypothetical protein